MLYKSKKWEKAQQQAINNNRLDNKMNQMFELDNLLDVGKIDILKYCYMKSNNYFMASNTAYLLGEEEKCKEYINTGLDYRLKAVRISKENENVNQHILDKLTKSMKENKAAYYAVAVNRDADAKQLLIKEHCIQHLLNNEIKIVKDKYVENSENFSQILLALCNHDSKGLKKAIENRVSLLRKQPADSLIPLDIWSVAFLKISQKTGMEWEGHLIEIPEFLLEL